MKKTRIVRILTAALCCAVLLCSCGGDKNEPKQSGTQQSSGGSSSAAATSESAAPTVLEPMKIDFDKIAEEMQQKFDALTANSTRDSVKFALLYGQDVVVSGVSGKFVSDKTIYGIASVSKIMAVTAVMQLIEEGKAELDAPVINYLPEFKMQDERYKQITVRMLMNHSSGLMGNTVGGGWRMGAFGDTSYHDGFLDALSTQRLRSDPGAFSVYCNDGFTLLELICEKLSGMKYEQYLREKIFEPLGMNNTYSPLEKFDTSKIAVSDYGGLGDLPSLTTDPAQGGMYSDAVDLCKFGKTFTESGSRVLSAESVKAMAEAEYKRGVWCEDGENTMNYGLGWDSVDFYPFSALGIKAVAKNGDVMISGSQIIILPEYDLVAAVTCSGTSSTSCKQILTYILLEILKQDEAIDQIPERPELTASEDPIPGEVLKFEGTYLRTSGGFRISFIDNTMIKSALPGGSKTTYKHIGNGHFTDNGISDYWFVEQDGKQYHVSRTWSDAGDTVSLPSVSFLGSKTEETALSEEVINAWKARKGKTYLLVSEPYDSFGYIYPTYGLAIPSYQLTVSVDPSDSPFWRGMLITGADTAENAAEVPISGSTNAVDAVFKKIDGAEYIYFSNGLVYRSAEGIPTYDPDATIPAGETARWYRSDDDWTVTYNIPEGCGIAVYNKSMKKELNTAVTNDDEIELEAGYYVVFIGNGEFVPVK